MLLSFRRDSDPSVWTLDWREWTRDWPEWEEQMLKEYPACGQKPIEVECAECHGMINIKDAIWKDWPECAM